MTLYSFGNIDLIVGDCRKVMKNMPSESFNLIIADPPYRLASWKGFGRNHDKSYGTAPLKYSEWLSECFRLLKEDGSLFVFEAPMNEYRLERAMTKVGFKVQAHLIWVVSFRASHPAKGYYNNHWEPIMWGTKLKSGWYFDSEPMAGKGWNFGGDVMVAPGQTFNVIVPGQKPDSVIRRLILAHTKPGDMVLDPFAGSCVTLRMAKELGRRATGIEINPEVAEKAIEYRMLKTPGVQNFLELGDGKARSDTIH
jgi:DNA modification methylase